MSRNGFTLIELLIVVAIIAVLAVLALPRFQDALVKSRLSRVKGDFNSLEKSLHQYYLENKSFPERSTLNHKHPDNPRDFKGAPSFPGIGICLGFRQLTTPVAYLTLIPKDPFNITGHDIYVQAGQPDNIWWTYEMGTGSWLRRAPPWRGTKDRPHEMYLLTSFGPNRIDEVLGTTGFPTKPRGLILYDPTNGLMSKGDMLHFGGREIPYWAPQRSGKGRW